MIQMTCIGEQLDGVEQIARTGLNAVEYLRFLGILFIIYEFVRSGVTEIAGVVKLGLDHFGTQLWTHIAHQHRLLGQLLVNPVFKPLLGIGPVVVDPQSERKRIAPFQSLYIVVGRHIDSRLDLCLDTARHFLVIGAYNLDFFHSGIEHIIGSEALCRRA